MAVTVSSRIDPGADLLTFAQGQRIGWHAGDLHWSGIVCDSGHFARHHAPTGGTHTSCRCSAHPLNSPVTAKNWCSAPDRDRPTILADHTAEAPTLRPCTRLPRSAVETPADVLGVLRHVAFGHLVTSSAGTAGPALTSTALPFVVDDTASTVRAHFA